MLSRHASCWFFPPLNQMGNAKCLELLRQTEWWHWFPSLEVLFIDTYKLHWDPLHTDFLLEPVGRIAVTFKYLCKMHGLKLKSNLYFLIYFSFAFLWVKIIFQTFWMNNQLYLDWFKKCSLIMLSQVGTDLDYEQDCRELSLLLVQRRG